MKSLYPIFTAAKHFYHTKRAIPLLPETKLAWPLLLLVPALYLIFLLAANVVTGGYALQDVVEVFRITLRPVRGDTPKLLLIARDVFLLFIFLVIVLPVLFALIVKGAARLARRTISFWRILNVMLYAAVYKASMFVIIIPFLFLITWILELGQTPGSTQAAVMNVAQTLLQILFFCLVAYGIGLSLRRIN